MLKRRQDGRPKFPNFFKNRPKMLAITVFGPRCLLEASKNLSRASREPPKSPSRALKRHPKAGFLLEFLTEIRNASKQQLVPEVVPIVACLLAFRIFIRILINNPKRKQASKQATIGTRAGTNLGPKTVIASIFGRFLKKIKNFGRPSWRRFNIKNRIFFRVRRGYPT